MANMAFTSLFVFALFAGVQSSADVRLIDAAGSLSSVGLLQVNTDAGFGTVCGANAAAADATLPALESLFASNVFVVSFQKA